MRIYCCQHDIIWEDRLANHRRVEELLRQAKCEAGSLVLLPEMFATGFSMDVERVADADGVTAEFLSHLAAAYGITLVAGVAARDSTGRGLNQARVFDAAGRAVATYTKMHSFRYSGEHEHFQSGDRTAQFSWGGLRVSPFVCYDLRFPEVFRVAVGKGTHLFAVLANWPAARESHWVALLQARAIENQAYVAAVNRVGADPQAKYGGHSLIIDPRGVILAAGGAEEAVISAEVNGAALEAYRREFPALCDLHAHYIPREE